MQVQSLDFHVFSRSRSISPLPHTPQTTTSAPGLTHIRHTRNVMFNLLQNGLRDNTVALYGRQANAARLVDAELHTYLRYSCKPLERADVCGHGSRQLPLGGGTLKLRVWAVQSDTVRVRALR